MGGGAGLGDLLALSSGTFSSEIHLFAVSAHSPMPGTHQHGNPQQAKPWAALPVPLDTLSQGLRWRWREGNLAPLLAGLNGDAAGEVRPGGSRRAVGGPEDTGGARSGV